jgi:hypothetical protein
MQELRNYIKQVEIFPVAEIDTATNGSSIDTYQSQSQGYNFDTMLVRAGVGELGTDIASVKVKVQESDTTNFASSQTARGGDEVTVEEDGTATFQVERSKRYIRVVVTPVEADSPSETPGEDTALVYATAIMTNWAVPMPIL